MPDIIGSIRPHQLNSIKTYNDYLICIKNILRTISKKGCHVIEGENLFFAFRWSQYYKTWVLDRGTQLDRDINGICLNNLNKFYNNQDNIYIAISHILNSVTLDDDFLNIAHNINLNKNETKFVLLSYNIETKSISILGTYQFCENKKRKGVFNKDNKKAILIDNTNNLFNNVTLNKSHILKFDNDISYLDLFIKFKNILKNIKAEYTIKGSSQVKTFSIVEDLHKSLNKNVSLHLNKKISDKISFEKDLSENEKGRISTYFLNKTLYDFIQDKLVKSRQFILYDDISLNTINISDYYTLEEKEVKEKTSFSYLPGVF